MNAVFTTTVKELLRWPVGNKDDWTRRFDGMIDEAKFNELFASPTLARFLTYAQRADNWNGKPYVGCHNMGAVTRDDEYVQQMIEWGWITVCQEHWITFTAAGVKQAAEYGEDILWTLTDC